MHITVNLRKEKDKLQRIHASHDSIVDRIIFACYEICKILVYLLLADEEKVSGTQRCHGSTMQDLGETQVQCGVRLFDRACPNYIYSTVKQQHNSNTNVQKYGTQPSISLVASTHDCSIAVGGGCIVRRSFAIDCELCAYNFHCNDNVCALYFTLNYSLIQNYTVYVRNLPCARVTPAVKSSIHTPTLTGFIANTM